MIAGTALGVLNGGLGNLLGNLGTGCNRPAPTAVDGTVAALMSGMVAGMSNHNCTCNEDKTVNRYELAQESRIADLQSQIALRDANTYNDQKLLEVYKYFDGKLETMNSKLCDQAVWNATQTATIGCMAQQIAALNSLTKLVVPNTSVCPGWGNVTITPSTTTAG